MHEDNLTPIEQLAQVVSCWMFPSASGRGFVEGALIVDVQAVVFQVEYGWHVVSSGLAL